MRVASFNIEKNGKSSTDIKQGQVSTFLDNCCSNKYWDVDLVFICEMHYAQLENYTLALSAMYPGYKVASFNGGHSNGYIVLAKDDPSISIDSQGHLFALNRDLIAVEVNGFNGYSGYVILAHFKSGQNKITKTQIQSCTGMGGNWVVTGDINYDYNNAHQLGVNGKAYECWNGLPTQAHGNILDWVLASPSVEVKAVDITELKDVFDMSGPDHRPIVFDIRT